MDTTRNSKAQAAIQIIGEVREAVGVVARIAGQIAGLLIEQPIFWMLAAVVIFMVGMGMSFSATLL